MPDWIWFIFAFGLGGGLLALAVAADRRARRRVTGAGQPAPHRGIAEVDQNVPTYLTQDEIDHLPSPADGTAPITQAGEGFSFGHAHPDFATGPTGASWQTPRILIVDGPIETTRELISSIAQASPDRPLMIVAEYISDEVLATLAANRRALRRPVLAAVANQPDRLRLAELTGATLLESSDLRAGYIPDTALGIASSWSSNLKQTWVTP